MMRLLPLRGLLLLALLVPSALFSRSAAADDLVEGILEAYGGREALTRARGWQELGALESPRRGKASMVRVLGLPDRLRVETHFEDGSRETRILSGKKGWRSGQVAEGPLHTAMVLQAARLALPQILLHAEGAITDLGEIEREGASYRLLEIELHQGARLQIEVDPRTHRIRRSRSLADPLVFETRFDDFRKVDGLLFAFEEETWAMGVYTGRLSLQAVDLDNDLPDRLFRP